MSASAVLQANLAEAEDALRKLLTGQSVARVRSQSGEIVEYRPVDVALLRQYIEDLRRQINGTTILGPARPFW